jgi:hypothetical protein
MSDADNDLLPGEVKTVLVCKTFTVEGEEYYEDSKIRMDAESAFELSTANLVRVIDGGSLTLERAADGWHNITLWGEGATNQPWCRVEFLRGSTLGGQFYPAGFKCRLRLSVAKGLNHSYIEDSKRWSRGNGGWLPTIAIHEPKPRPLDPDESKRRQEAVLKGLKKRDSWMSPVLGK